MLGKTLCNQYLILYSSKSFSQEDLKFSQFDSPTNAREGCFPRGSNGKESTCNAGDPGLMPRLGIFPGEGNSNPLQYSCPENPMNWRTWWAMVRGVTHGPQSVRHDWSDWARMHGLFSVWKLLASLSILFFFHFLKIFIYLFILLVGG